MVFWTYISLRDLVCGNLKDIYLLRERGVARKTWCYRKKDSSMHSQPIHNYSVRSCRGQVLGRAKGSWTREK